MNGNRSRTPIAVLAALVLAACGRGTDIAGLYVEVEALGPPTMILLNADGSGSFVAQIGGDQVRDPFEWAHDDGDLFTARYFSGANQPAVTESFRFEDDVLVFDSDNTVGRYARVEDASEIQAGRNDVPFAPFN